MKKYVIGRIEIRPGLRDAYMALAKDYIAACRNESGFIYYEEGPNFEDPNKLIVIECWNSPEAHAAHTRSAHFAAFGPVFMQHVVHAHFEEMSVHEVYDVVIDAP